MEFCLASPCKFQVWIYLSTWPYCTLNVYFGNCNIILCVYPGSKMLPYTHNDSMWIFGIYLYPSKWELWRKFTVPSSWFCCRFKFKFRVLLNFLSFWDLLLLFTGFISYNNCWKSRVLCMDKQKLESQRGICANSHICNWLSATHGG